MTIKPDRAEIFDFSDGYFEDGQIMVVAADSAVATLDDLKGKVVATKAVLNMLSPSRISMASPR